ncbi:hypothetical protein [Nonomuraea helvata]|uniref:Uncharacterized protein n=1 Tax=Nonomuraea helvata TaxID=37484 RepID=A0ABV5SBR8_9ACTN
MCAPAGAAAEVAPLLREAGANVLLASCVDNAATRQSDPPITAIDLRPKEAGRAARSCCSSCCPGPRRWAPSAYTR